MREKLKELENTKIIDFDDFINNYPEETAYKYELYEGVMAMSKPTGKHSQISGYLITRLGWEIMRLSLPYFIPKDCLIKHGNLSAYDPDVLILDKDLIKQESRWDSECVITNGNSVKLVIEVVSTNWGNDYGVKLDAYETLKIKEYWIVDYLGLGGRRFIGNPKQPTVTVNYLVDEEYQQQLFRLNDEMRSPLFPELKLTLAQIIDNLSSGA